MKALIIHNAYQQYGGEDTVVRMESNILEQHGNLAGLHIVSNDRITGLWGKLAAAVSVVFSLSGYRTVRRVIREQRPDVVHVHNFFPLLSPSVFYACQAEAVPVVMTLHNFRIVCPTALLMHDGKVTDRSLRDGPWWALKHRVYRGSWVGTFLLCLMIWLHARIGTWRNKVDRLIALTDFGRGRFIEAGLPAEKLVVKPNFVDISPPLDTPRTGLLFVGRLSKEKGIEVLLDAVRNKHDLRDRVHLIGDGPLANLVAHSGIACRGKLEAAEVNQHMNTASALLMPSIWYEGFPMTLVEAYASGLPVIASRIGALAELVEEGVTGLLFEPGNAADLSVKMVWALDHPEDMQKMGRAARLIYEQYYAPQCNYEQLMTIYHEAITEFASKHEGSIYER